MRQSDSSNPITKWWSRGPLLPVGGNSSKTPRSAPIRGPTAAPFSKKLMGASNFACLATEAIFSIAFISSSAKAGDSEPRRMGLGHLALAFRAEPTGRTGPMAWGRRSRRCWLGLQQLRVELVLGSISPEDQHRDWIVEGTRWRWQAN